jgi:hypothetical protein
MMSTNGGPADRRAAAEAALAELDGELSAHRRLEVRCRRSHHVAAVYDTDIGLIYRAVVGTRGHGHQDRIDVGHRGDPRGRIYADVLDAGDDPMADDDLPATCQCGPRTLSRSALLASLAERHRHFFVS